jgi:hypothetical protein
MVSDEQIKSLTERLATLARCLNIEQRRIDLANEEEKTQEPNFWGSCRVLSFIQAVTKASCAASSAIN